MVKGSSCQSTFDGAVEGTKGGWGWGEFIRIYYKFATSHVYEGYGPRRRIVRPLIQMMSKEGAPLGCYLLGNRAVI